MRVPVSPRPRETYQGLLHDPHVRPAPAGGTWYPVPFEASDLQHRRKIILHLHGGAFVLSDARDMNCAFAANTIMSAIPAKVFFLEYCLSSTPGNRFPAALQDVATA